MDIDRGGTAKVHVAFRLNCHGATAGENRSVNLNQPGRIDHDARTGSRQVLDRNRRSVQLNGTIGAGRRGIDPTGNINIFSAGGHAVSNTDIAAHIDGVDAAFLEVVLTVFAVQD